MVRRLAPFALILLTAFPRLAGAHEKGAMYLSSKQVPSGSQMSLRGERMPKNATLRLELRGKLETFRLADIHTDAKGTFTARIGLPPEAHAGSYSVVAIASDGDKAAEASLVVVAAAEPAHDSSMHAAPNTSPNATSSQHATAELMPVAVSTSTGEWAGIAAIVGLSLALGLTLLARGRDS